MTPSSSAGSARLDDVTLDRLHTPAAMRAFIEARPDLFARPIGGAEVYHCRCPLDAHSKQRDSNPYLSVFIGAGHIARFKCSSCGEKGDAIELAQKALRLDFRSACAEIARCAGVALRDAPPCAYAPPRSPRPAAPRPPRLEEPWPLELLPPEVDCMLRRDTAQEMPDSYAEDVAAQLELPADAVRRHLEVDNPFGGVIGFTPPLNPAGSPRVIRPVFLFFARDEHEEAALIAAKVRYGGEESRRGVSRFVALDDTGHAPALRYAKPKPCRFNFITGKPCRPWGWEALTSAAKVIFITEGESDKLAMETVLAASRALPPAFVTLSIPGAGGHRSLDPSQLLRRKIVYIADNDATQEGRTAKEGTGDRAARETLAFLKAHGAGPLYSWMPPREAGQKKTDLRAHLLARGLSEALYILEDILKNRIPYD